MLELSAHRKIRLNLSDYEWEKDAELRSLFSDLHQDESDVIEEIFYSPLKTSFRKLSRSLELCESRLEEILNKLEKGLLLQKDGDQLIIDKEMRRRYELQMERLRPGFRPDIDFMQEILRKVPIHVLPSWYAISRTSDNIFQSILDKYLLSPQTFQRYLLDIAYPETWIADLIKTLFSHPDLKISSSDCIARYNLTRKSFDAASLFLEFSFVACLTYEKEGDHWVEFLSPFHEWKEYLSFLRATEAPCLNEDTVEDIEGDDFAYVRALSLSLEEKKPLPAYREKALTLRFLTEEGALTEEGKQWLSSSLEKRALALYKHPLNAPILSPSMGERALREAEKTARRMLHGKWVLFEDFFQGALPVFREEHTMPLKRGKTSWSYERPVYTEEEKQALFKTIFFWLKEIGMVATGTFQNQPCFRLTEFGCFFFEE